MARVKGGTVTRKRRKKVLKLAKGYYGSKHTLFKTAKEQVMNSYNYAYRDRRQKKRDFRKLWIARINAASRMNGLSYSNQITIYLIMQRPLIRAAFLSFINNKWSLVFISIGPRNIIRLLIPLPGLGEVKAYPNCICKNLKMPL